MSGHSKWSTIKHKKAARDQARGNVFTSMANAITIAVKKGGSTDLEANFSLRLAVERAKAVNMPGANIERAIAKGAGLAEGQTLEELIMEGYGPGGVGIIIEAVTDKHNRTVAEIKNILESSGGRLGEPGSVLYLFDKVGWVTIEGILNDEQTMTAIDDGVMDVETIETHTRFTVKPDHVQSLTQELNGWGYKIVEMQLGYQAKTNREKSDRGPLGGLIDLLEDQADVQEVYTT